MDLTEEKVSFDQMPTVVSELKQEISGLKTLVRTLIDATGAAPKDAWMNIDELRAYHPDHPARPTIYEWVGKKAIPVHKDGKKLRFLRSEIDEWLNGGRAKTQAELIHRKLMSLDDLTDEQIDRLIEWDQFQK